MDAELKQWAERVEGKIDQLSNRFDKLETSHDADHDELIRLQGKLEAHNEAYKTHCDGEETKGRGQSERIDKVDGKVNKLIIALIILLVGGGSTQLPALIKLIIGG